MSTLSPMIGNEVTIKGVLECVKNIDPATNPNLSKADEIASGILFAEVFKSCARYNTTAKVWYVYNGVVWKPDNAGVVVERYADMLQRMLLVYSATLDKSYNEYETYAHKLADRSRRESMLKDARKHCTVTQTDFDADPKLFNCQNCVLNLETFETLEHSPELLLSMVSNVVYNPDASPAMIHKFINDVMSGDTEKARYLQQASGYALTGSNSQEELYILYGATTRNGKSTFTDAMGYLFGDYGSNIQPETLAKKNNKDSRSASGDIARLKGVRFLNCSEPPENMVFDVALVKALTGGDIITARHLYEREFQFVPTFKLFINTNHLPRVLDGTLFTSGRVKVIPFDRHFESEEQDVHLKEKLKEPENVSALLNWCLAGLQAYRKAGEVLALPASVQTATAQYKNDSDKLSQFINDCLLKADGINSTGKQAYTIFQEWCRSNGFGVESRTRFFTSLRNRGLMQDTGTVTGALGKAQTTHNVIVGYAIDADFEDNPFN